MIPTKNLLLKQLIWGNGVTQKEIAYQVGMNEPEFSGLIHGYRKPSQEEAQAISAILGEPAESLFPEGMKDS